MKIYIMTRGRIGKQRTLKSIPTEYLTDTYLVVPQEEHNKHVHKTIPVPPHIDNYSKKFQWLLDGNPHQSEKIVIMDDDLVFSTRNHDEKLITIKDPEDVTIMFDLMRDLLDTTALVGVHPRQHGDKAPLPYKENGKVICIQGVNRSKIPDDIRVDSFPILADVFLNCHLLSRGISNKLITIVCQDHGSCQAPGGCSIYRTPQMQKDAVLAVAAEFGPFAKAVTKKPKVAKWMGDERTDLIVQWKKMYAAGVEDASS